MISEILNSKNISEHNSDDYVQFAERVFTESIMKTVTTTNPITIVENSSSIIIYAYIYVSGPEADTIIPGTQNENGTGGITYREATVNGIKKYWSGEYDGKKVKVINCRFK